MSSVSLIDTFPDYGAHVPDEENEGRKKAPIRSITRRIVKRGGPGSGNHGHSGLSGVWGGSSPSAGSPSKPQPKNTRVGITSARPERKGESDIYADMADFAKNLKSIKTVSGVTVEPGQGGWEGGSEPTWVVSYDGNGEATQLLARTGLRYNQDGVLIYKPCEGGDCSPVIDWVFEGELDATDQTIVESALVDSGIGGWTWFANSGKLTLRALSVPQWGGDADAHMQSASKMDEFFSAAQFENTRVENMVSVTVMTREGEFAYDTYLED
jgi:hypothetical protein